MGAKVPWTPQGANDSHDRPVDQVQHCQGMWKVAVNEPYPVSGRLVGKTLVPPWVRAVVVDQKFRIVTNFPSGIDESPGQVGFLEGVEEVAGESTDLFESATTYYTGATGKGGDIGRISGSTA